MKGNWRIAGLRLCFRLKLEDLGLPFLLEMEVE